MKWGRKNPSASLSTRLPSIAQVLPVSWLSKFKRRSVDSEPKPAKEKHQGKWNSVSTSSQKSPSGGGGRFYGGDDDGFWRLSFGEENVEGKKYEGALRSVWYDSDDELEAPPNSTRVLGKEESKKFSRMVSNVRKMRELSRDVENLLEMDTSKRGREAAITTPRFVTGKNQGFRKRNRRVLEHKKLGSERQSHTGQCISSNSVGKGVLEAGPERTILIIEKQDFKPSSDSRKDHYVASSNLVKHKLTSTEEDHAFAAQNAQAQMSSPEWQKLKEIKTEQLKTMSDKPRRSAHIRRELQRRRTKQNSRPGLYSPRTASRVEICKIKALEDMKKARLKMVNAKEQRLKGRPGLDSFAVVKCSFDPQKDFRDSMIEMIMDKDIRSPEKLEELLACYLTLNSDEYHDLIIKVFRQVWFDLNKASFDFELQNEQCLSD